MLTKLDHLKKLSTVIILMSSAATMVNAAGSTGPQPPNMNNNNNNAPGGMFSPEAMEQMDTYLAMLDEPELMKLMGEMMAKGEPRRTQLAHGKTLGAVWQNWGEYIRFWFNTFCQMEFAAREIAKQPWGYPPPPEMKRVFDVVCAVDVNLDRRVLGVGGKNFDVKSIICEEFDSSPHVLSMLMGVDIEVDQIPSRPPAIRIRDGQSTLLVDVIRIYNRLDKAYSSPEKDRNIREIVGLHGGLVRRLKEIRDIINRVNGFWDAHGHKVYAQECLRAVQPFQPGAQEYATSRLNQLIADILPPRELTESEMLDKTLSGKVCDPELVERLRVSKPGELVWTRRIGGSKLWDFRLCPPQDVNTSTIDAATRESCEHFRAENVLPQGQHRIMVSVPNKEGRHVYVVREVDCYRNSFWDHRTHRTIVGDIVSVNPRRNYGFPQPGGSYLVEVVRHQEGDRTAFASFMGVHSNVARVKGTPMEARVHSVLQQHRVHGIHQLPLEVRAQLEKEQEQIQRERIRAQLDRERLATGGATPQEELEARVAKRNEREWQQISHGVRVHAVPEAYHRVHRAGHFVHYTDEKPGIEQGKRVSSLLRIHERVHTPHLNPRERAFLADTGRYGYQNSSEGVGIAQGNANDAYRNRQGVEAALGDFDLRDAKPPANPDRVKKQRDLAQAQRGQGTNVTRTFTDAERQRMLEKSAREKNNELP